MTARRGALASSIGLVAAAHSAHVQQPYRQKWPQSTGFGCQCYKTPSQINNGAKELAVSLPVLILCRILLKILQILQFLRVCPRAVHPCTCLQTLACTGLGDNQSTASRLWVLLLPMPCYQCQKSRKKIGTQALCARVCICLCVRACVYARVRRCGVHMRRLGMRGRLHVVCSIRVRTRNVDLACMALCPHPFHPAPQQDAMRTASVDSSIG